MTLQQAKDYLRIDFNEDDIFIESLIEVSDIYISKCCGESYKTDEKLTKLATLLQYKLISDMYENRSTTIDNTKTDIIVSTIIATLANASMVTV